MHKALWLWLWLWLWQKNKIQIRSFRAYCPNMYTYSGLKRYTICSECLVFVYLLKTHHDIFRTYSYIIYFMSKRDYKLKSLVQARHLFYAMVLIFCVEFLELSHLTHGLSQAEKKVTVVTSWATDKMTTIFTQNDNFAHFEWNICNFVNLLSL